MPSPLPFPGMPAADAWQAARETAVVADASAVGLVAFTGPEAAAFLHGQLSTDVKALRPGHAHWSTYNSPKGRMLATLFLGRPASGAADRYEALLAADVAAAVAKRLAMFVLRSKLTVADETAAFVRFGVGGPNAAGAVAAALGAAPPPGGYAVLDDGTRIAHLPDARLVVLAPEARSAEVLERLAVHATPAAADVWTWLGIRAGVPMVTAATQDQFVAQTANQDALGALDFRKGCYPGQEIVARTQYLGRLKERLFVLAADAPPPGPGTRLYAPAFGDQACGTVVNSAPDPGGGSLLLGVLQTGAGAGPVALGAVNGPAVRVQALPYALPEPVEPRGRVKL
ncbi:MAG TPA: folate-binding protein [Casimicrobiaceae bacterium]|nr:folate-binding protein [Casimicrobiaceae bacterium]